LSRIKDISLADIGKKRIEWALNRMPVLNGIRSDYENQKPLKGIRIAACLHVTTETANLVITLKSLGADVRLCASNPLSTQDDVAAALVKYYGIEVFATKGESEDEYYSDIYSCLDFKPHITLDDGADLTVEAHKSGAWREYSSLSRFSAASACSSSMNHFAATQASTTRTLIDPGLHG